MKPRRDRRLAIALLLFAFAAMAATLQSVIAANWMNATVIGHWEWFVDTWGGELPARGPKVFCFDWCAPELPFWAGWLAIGCFASGFVLIAWTWWRPKA